MKPIEKAAQAGEEAGSRHITVNHRDWYNERRMVETKATISAFLKAIKENPIVRQDIGEALMAAYEQDENMTEAVIEILAQEANR